MTPITGYSPPNRSTGKKVAKWMLPSTRRVYELPDVSPADLSYVGEGAANAVFAFEHEISEFIVTRTASNMSPSEQQPTLLRLPKLPGINGPASKMLSQYHNYIYPIFEDDQLVEVAKVRVDDNLLEACNDVLKRLETARTRPEKRRGIYCCSLDQTGILMTDMNPQKPGDFTIEFKPKWLIQSPSAPSKSIRCRTCALREMRNSEARAKGKQITGARFCPLDLLSDEENTRRAAVREFGAPDTKVAMFASILHRNVTLRTLKEHQQRYNEVGLIDFQKGSDNCAIGMTLRDCTLFIRANDTHTPYTFECRLADLDFKECTRERRHKWIATELALVEGGWYEGTEEDKDSNKRSCTLHLVE